MKTPCDFVSPGEDFENDVDRNEDTDIADKNKDTNLTESEHSHHNRPSNATQDNLSPTTTQLHNSAIVYHQLGAYK